jgi:hypothetical protein
MGYNTKESNQYFEKYKNKIFSTKEELLNKEKEYLNLPHEIWARFSQAIAKTYLMGVDFEGDGIKYFMYDIHKSVKDFMSNYHYFSVLPKKMKLRLIKAVVQFWHLEQEEMKRLNNKMNK